jgi:hypothetical protein
MLLIEIASVIDCIKNTVLLTPVLAFAGYHVQNCSNRKEEGIHVKPDFCQGTGI